MLKRAALILMAAGYIISCNMPSGEKKENPQKIVFTPENAPPDDMRMMQGKIIAQTAANALISELNYQLSRKGITKTIRYCNLRAIPITDSLSTLYKADIRRTSLRIRNPLNSPTEDERKVLKDYAAKLEGGNNVSPLLQTGSDGKIHFYAPIFTQAFCLGCHGKVGAELGVEHHKVISELYPDDQATGYGPGEFRGMWSITFEN